MWISFCKDQIKDLQEKSDFVLGGTRVKVWSGTVEGLLVHFLEPDNGSVSFLKHCK